jgi:hypothetical protein
MAEPLLLFNQPVYPTKGGEAQRTVDKNCWRREEQATVVGYAINSLRWLDEASTPVLLFNNHLQ